MTVSWPLVLAAQQAVVLVCVLFIVVPRACFAWRVRRQPDGLNGLRMAMLLWGVALLAVTTWNLAFWADFVAGWTVIPDDPERRAPLAASVWAVMDVAALVSVWLYWRHWRRL